MTEREPGYLSRQKRMYFHQPPARQRGVQSVSLGYQKHQGTRVSAQESIPLIISKAESAPPLGVV
jgi:hypothetical protein